MSLERRREAAQCRTNLAMRPQIAYVYGVGESEQAPGNPRMSHDRVHVEDSHVVGAVAEIADIYFHIAIQHLLCGLAGLPHRERFIVADKCLAKIVDFRQVAAQGNGSIDERPERKSGALLLIGEAIDR